MLPENQEKLSQSFSGFDQKVRIEQALSMFKQVFETLARDAGTSETLFNLGLEDEFTKIVKQLLENPIEELYGTIRKISFEFSELQKMIINQFILLSFKKTDLCAAYLEKNDNSPLTYHLCLKENSLHNRGKIRKILGTYNDNEISEQFPVILHFIDERIHKELEEQYSNNRLFDRIEG